MLKKLFGKKKSNYFLELKEEANPEKTSKSEASAQPKAEKPPEAPAAAAEAKPAQEAAKSKSSKSKKSSVKAQKSASVSEKQPEKTEPVTLLTPFPASVTSANQNGKAEPQEVAFASKYSITPTMSRRRPGPSLNTYKSMARQVKKTTFKG